MKRGSLVCVGSGIKSVGHLTLEAKGWIEQSDIVVYCVADPATEVWIKKHCRASFDLYRLYGNTKKRIDTYNDMVQVMLDNVRAGRDTCAVFYGHPGLFVLPTHKAISILRAEGYRAAMLAGISATDCLWADLGVDPSAVGYQTVEATDLLLRGRSLSVDSHVVVWQIGCVGDLGFNFAGYDNRNLGILVDYLETFYGPDHEVIHYQAAQYPVCNSRCDRMKLSELRQAAVTGISTLYIPPKGTRPTNSEIGVRLGLMQRKAQPAAAVNPGPARPAPAMDRAGQPAAATARSEARTAGPAENGRLVRPYAHYMPTPKENGLADYIAAMMEDPRVLASFMRDPELSSSIHASLSAAQRQAILSLHPGRIRLAMKESPHEELLAGIAQAHGDAAQGAAPAPVGAQTGVPVVQDGPPQTNVTTEVVTEVIGGVDVVVESGVDVVEVVNGESISADQAAELMSDVALEQ
jgi:Tetrapyrrole (Corrin/Porphyrin) Methylases